MLALAATGAEPEPLPVIPVGEDAYLQWDRWPYQRIGARAYMRSTYDRRGGNESADASHFLYQEAKDFNVTLDVAGPGMLYFARYNHWHGSPWHYEVDGVDHIVQETSTADPLHPAENSVWLPEALFPTPLAWTWSATKGANLSWVPIGFEKSFRMAYSRTRYGTGYYIYHQFVPGAPLSRPISAWGKHSIPDRRVLDLLRRAGTDIAPQPYTAEGKALGVVKETGHFDLPKDDSFSEAFYIILPPKDQILFMPEIRAQGPAPLITHTQGPSMIRSLEFSVPREQAAAFARAKLRITWDGRAEPSVEAPVALFFGTGTFYNRDDREYLVKGFPMNVRYEGDRVVMACYFPMPFFREARLELVGSGEGEGWAGIEWSVSHHPIADPPSHLGYFHATYRDHGEPVRGRDLVLLDTREAEGGGDWSGSFVGTSFIFTHRNVLTTLEGDPRFFFDDSQTPQAYGTGTEEWGGGGDYWGGRNMTLPLAGHPVGARTAEEAKNAGDQIHSAYRFLLADLMPFGKNARIQLEHGGENESTEHYKTVTYWYGAPAPSLVKTDMLDIGDEASERAHGYVSPEASAPYEITSRYEWGVDTQRPAEHGPMAEPPDAAEFAFEAEAGVPYTIWVRGRALSDDKFSDATWLQFNGDIGTTRLGEGHRSPKGFGNWLDHFPLGGYEWSSGFPEGPPQTVTFAASGPQKLRVQPRHGPHRVNMIWLSRTQTTRPPNSALPSPGGRDEIVLTAKDARRVAGEIKRVADTQALSGEALEIGRTPEQAVFPPHTETGRTTTTQSEFTLTLNPANHGVLLRRTLDYSFPNQRAEVSVIDVDDSGALKTDAHWQPAGTWFLAGSNTCVYSDPPGELGETQHNVQTSNRRFRDDEFLLPRALTQGRSKIRVNVRFTGEPRPLFPGAEPAKTAWSEIRYTAYSYVLPQWQP